MKKTFAVLLMLAASVFSLCSCGKAPVEPKAQAISSVPGSIVEGEELLCLCDSREEAEQIAEQYGITLVDCSYGVAVFHAEGDLDSLIRTGKENGWPKLSYNTTSQQLH